MPASPDPIRPGTKPRYLPPMLASPLPPSGPDVQWIHERKLDGERIVAVHDGAQVRLWTRNRHDVTRAYPEIVAALGSQPVAGGFVVDGEVVAFDAEGNTSFSRLQRRMHRTDRFAAAATGVAVHYLVFDVLHIGDEDLREAPLLERKHRLKETFMFGDTFRFVPHRPGPGYDAFDAACRAGWEGLIAKRADSTYTSGRARLWRKIKCVRSDTFQIVGWTHPQGRRTGIGALLLASPGPGGLRYAGKVGTGLDEGLLRRLRVLLEAYAREGPVEDLLDAPVNLDAEWSEPVMACEVTFTERTEEGRLRHPVFKGLRRPGGDVQHETDERSDGAEAAAP